MALFLNSCATLKIKLNPINQSNAESDDGSDEQVEKIWIEYFDILNNGERLTEDKRCGNFGGVE